LTGFAEPRQFGSVTTAAGLPKSMKTIKLFTKIDLSLNSYSHVTHIGFPYLTNDFFYTKAQHRSFITFFEKAIAMQGHFSWPFR